MGQLTGAGAVCKTYRNKGYKLALYSGWAHASYFGCSALLTYRTLSPRPAAAQLTVWGD